MAETRESATISDLLVEVRNAGVKLKPAVYIELEGLPWKQRMVLRAVQACPVEIPSEILGKASRANSDEIAVTLQELSNRGLIQRSESAWVSSPALPAPETPEDLAFLSTLLQDLLAFVSYHGKDGTAALQVMNVVALSEICKSSSPELVARVFMAMDKLLKNTGDKRLVLKVANLSIGAAGLSGANRDESVVKGEAQALICGRSWVLQRIGRLNEALAAAQSSLEKGELISWGVNTAFAKKCMGRLYRLRAVESPSTIGPDQPSAEQGLSTSARLLKEAIRDFEQLEGFGPSHPEVGDCYSLLGRTLLAQGRMLEAGQAAARAAELIPEEPSRDYLDLLVLLADIDFKMGNEANALSYIDKAISIAAGSDPEIRDRKLGRNSEGATISSILLVGLKPAHTEMPRNRAFQLPRRSMSHLESSKLRPLPNEPP